MFKIFIVDHWSYIEPALYGTARTRIPCLTKPRHYHFSDDDRLRLHRYFGTRVGEIYVKINLKRYTTTTISGSLYSTQPDACIIDKNGKNDISRTVHSLWIFNLDALLLSQKEDEIFSEVTNFLGNLLELWFRKNLKLTTFLWKF